MIADMLNNKKLNPIVTELFITGRRKGAKKYQTKFYYYFIMKIPNKRELQRIASNYSSDIDFKDFMNLYKKCTVKPYSFLVIDATLASDNPSRFRKSFSERI